MDVINTPKFLSKRILRVHKDTSSIRERTTYKHPYQIIPNFLPGGHLTNKLILKGGVDHTALFSLCWLLMKLASHRVYLPGACL